MKHLLDQINTIVSLAKVGSPKIIFRTSYRGLSLIHDTQIDFSAAYEAGFSKFLVEIVENASNVRYHKTDRQYKIEYSDYNIKNTILSRSKSYVLSFLQANYKSPNVRLTKIYRWYSKYIGTNYRDNDYQNDLINIHEFLLTCNSPEKIALGIQVLEMFKTKYSAQLGEI